MDREKHDVYCQDTFYERFILDLTMAAGVVIIQSAFIRLRRTQFMLPHLQACLGRGVRVCVFLQRPQEEDQARELELCSQLLRQARIHVNMRDYIHEKLSVIDECILWDGSLNIMSQNRSFERMNRWESRQKTKAAVRKHKLDRCDNCPSPEVARFDAAFESHQRHILASAITSRRKELGLSQKELAARSGVTQATISGFEAGKRDVQLSTLSRLYRQLDMELRSPPSYLLPRIEWLLTESGS